MTTKAELRKAEQAEAIATMRAMVPIGATLQTIARHTSRSGMSHSISVVDNGECIDWLVCRITGDTLDERNGGVKRGGCGMDMGFGLVYDLARYVHGDGYAYKHRWL
jgi:hypothetical protein